MTRWNRLVECLKKQQTLGLNIVQLEEFKTSLDKMSSGDLGLVDTVGAMQLAIQAAISEVLSS